MKKVLHSLLALILCISMFMGTTYAWFTDSVTSGNNIIKSGNLDLEVYWSESLEDDSWKNAEDSSEGPIFNYDKCEPGYTSVHYIKFVNNGSLAFRYLLNIIPDGEMGILADVIDVYYIDKATQEVTSLDDMKSAGTLSEVILRRSNNNGVLLPAGETKEGYDSGETIVAIALKMQEDAGNEYQNKSIGKSFSIQVLATQFAYESDAFGNDYDTDAEMPVIGENSASATVNPTADNKVPSGGVQMLSTNGKFRHLFPKVFFWQAERTN